MQTLGRRIYECIGVGFFYKNFRNYYIFINTVLKMQLEGGKKDILNDFCEVLCLYLEFTLTQQQDSVRWGRRGYVSWYRAVNLCNMYAMCEKVFQRHFRCI